MALTAIKHIFKVKKKLIYIYNSKNFFPYQMWDIYGPRISAHVLPLDGKLAFYLKMIHFFLENDLELPLIFVLFLKGKQNKKENPKCDSLFGKCDLWKKPNMGSRLGYLSGRYDKDHSTHLSP